MITEGINKASASIISAMKLAANGDPKKEKQIALMENTLAFTRELTEVAILTTSGRKRILRPINRTPKRRMQRKQKIFRKIMNIKSLEMQRHMILSTPIPKYQKGGNSYSSIVGEAPGPELVMLKNGHLQAVKPISAK